MFLGVRPLGGLQSEYSVQKWRFSTSYTIYLANAK